MGDTGSLSLGATIGVIALMTGQWALLPVIAVIPVSEALSDIIQIAYFKLTHGRRFFKMAPIHLHFELLGWSEIRHGQARRHPFLRRADTATTRWRSCGKPSRT